MSNSELFKLLPLMYDKKLKCVHPKEGSDSVQIKVSLIVYVRVYDKRNQNAKIPTKAQIQLNLSCAAKSNSEYSSATCGKQVGCTCSA